MNDFLLVDLRDLFYRIIIKWRLIIAAALIGGILFNLAAVCKDVKYVKSLDNADAAAERDLLQSAADSLRNALTESEARDVEFSVSAYKSFAKNIDDYNDYMEKSVYASLDAGNVATMSMQYQVDTHYSVEYPVIERRDYTSDIVAAYITGIQGGTYEGVDDCISDAVNELISVNSDSDGTFSISILGKDEHMCQQISEAIIIKIDELTKQLEKQYKGYDIVLIASDYTCAANTTVLKDQQQLATGVNGVRVGITNLSGGFTEPQKAYYKALLNLNADNSEDREIEAAEARKNASVKWIHIKYIIVGLLLGAVFIAGLIVLKYIIEPVLRVDKHITDGFGVSSYGSIWKDDDKKRLLGFIDSAITRLFFGLSVLDDYQGRIDIIAKQIELEMKTDKLSSIYITGTNKTDSAVIASLYKELKKNAEVSYGVSAVSDKTSLEKLMQAEAVVFVEELGKARYCDISKELQLAKGGNTKVLGCITVNSMR